MGTVSGETRSFEAIRSVVANAPVLPGWNAISTVHRSPAAMDGDPEPQGRDPPSRRREKAASAGRARPETSNGAVPLFAIVTSRGAGRLFAVTLPKS